MLIYMTLPVSACHYWYSCSVENIKRPWILKIWYDLSVCLSVICVSLSICLSVCMTGWLSVYLSSVCMSIVCLSSVCPSLCPSTQVKIMCDSGNIGKKFCSVSPQGPVQFYNKPLPPHPASHPPPPYTIICLIVYWQRWVGQVMAYCKTGLAAVVWSAWIYCCNCFSMVDVI